MAVLQEEAERPARMTGMWITGARLVLPDGVSSGHVRVDRGRVSCVIRGGNPPATNGSIDVYDVRGLYLTPGFVDIHNHGGGGTSFDGTPEEAAAAARFHLHHGTTSTMASLVAAPLATLVDGIARLRELTTEGDIVGVHLEGPFLNPAKRGAQPESSLRPPSKADLAALLGAGAGAVRVVTLAPELPGSEQLLVHLRDAGVVAAIGHTNATYDIARWAFDRGATLATHLFNGMPGIHHRAGGPVAAALVDDRIICELIVDGHHLSDETVRLAFATAGPERIALITDAIAAAGAPEGKHHLGANVLEVVAGSAWLEDRSSLAGSLLTMADAVRNAVQGAGIPLPHAVTAATTTPARAIGLGDGVGSLSPDYRADLCLLDDELRVRGVMKAGRWVRPPVVATGLSED